MYKTFPLLYSTSERYSIYKENLSDTEIAAILQWIVNLLKLIPIYRERKSLLRIRENYLVKLLLKKNIYKQDACKLKICCLHL